jgi:hypothetical protein
MEAVDVKNMSKVGEARNVGESHHAWEEGVVDGLC